MSKTGRLREIGRISGFPRAGRLVAASLALCWGAPVAAQFSFCNQTFDVVNVAVGFYDDDDWVTEGWWTVGPNQCADVIRDDLRVQYVYLFAQDVFGKAVLEGAASMCVAPGRFEIRGRENCLINGYLSADFVEVDTRRSERWTFFLTPPPGT